MLIYLVVMVLVAAVVYLVAAAVFGRGEELAPLPPGASPTRLPADEATGEDIRAVRFQQVMRGYKMSEVDWVLSRLGSEVDQLRGRIAELEGRTQPVRVSADAATTQTTSTQTTGTQTGTTPTAPPPDGESDATEVLSAATIATIDGGPSGPTESSASDQ